MASAGFLGLWVPHFLPEQPASNQPEAPYWLVKLFWLQDGEISLEEFESGIFRIKGMARRWGCKLFQGFCQKKDVLQPLQPPTFYFLNVLLMYRRGVQPH